MTQLERADLHAAIETRYPDNITEDITPKRLRDGLHELVDSVFVTATDTGAVPNVPLYAPGTFYIVGYLVRYTPLGGQQGFYAAQRAGKLLPPGLGNLADWKQVAPPVAATALSQRLTLVQAQGIDGAGVVTGRDYEVEFGNDAQGYMQTITLRGVSGEKFDKTGALEVNGRVTAVTNVDVQAGTWDLLVVATAPVSVATRSQHSTSQGLRTTGGILFQTAEAPTQLVATVIDNVTSLSAQVNYRDPAQNSIWSAGAIRSSASNTPAALAALFAQVLSDIQAIPPAGLAIAGELMLRTQPVDSALGSNFFLDGLIPGRLIGESKNFRVSYSGPPIGNLFPNSQFQNTNQFWAITSGWAYGGGQASSVNGAPNGASDALYCVLGVQAGTYNLTVGVLALNSLNVPFDIESPQGAPAERHYLNSVGDTTIPITVATGMMQLAFRGPCDVVLSHVYLVP